MVKICNLIIEYSFYVLFFLVPLVFASNTSELFELNKMWLTWGFAILIGAFWFAKMILQRKFGIQRTPLDIPIVLFLVSQIISTIFSLDSHVSFWGYYSRFNGGLLSTLTYIFLYYSFVSNLLSKTIVKRLLITSLASGLIVALWGLPSHYGYDPTCYIFRKTLDVSCWTADFMPRVRIFSTLGQPAWLAAYLAILIPIAIAFFTNVISDKQKEKRNNFLLIVYSSLITLFYLGLTFANTRAGFIAFWIGNLVFWTLLWFKELVSKQRIYFYIFFSIYIPLTMVAFFFLNSSIGIPIILFLSICYFVFLFILNRLWLKPFIIINILLLIVIFINGTPISQINKFTLPQLKQNFEKAKTPNNPEKAPTPNQTQQSTQTASGGTESADIRLLVWKGGLEAWKNNPLFGTGVETFAYAYYKYKPAGQNLTSEWNFLYNKAHNEYVNYLATTGAFGLGSYVLMIGFFLTIVILRLKAEGSQILRSAQNDKPNNTLILALLAAYISILITNFFGFSVVITNIYLFLIPAFVLILGGMVPQNKINSLEKINYNTSIWQWTPIFFVFVAGLYMLFMLFRLWNADTAYALGYNLSRAGQYQAANENLRKAVELRPGEPVFKDELSINNAAIAVSLINQNDQEQATSAASFLTQEAINASNEIVSKFPNNAAFWKTRVRLFYTLSQVDSRYLPRALDAIIKASLLAPQDANILYNLGVLYGQNNDIAKGIEALEKTIKLKPDYRDARYALGLFYREKALDKDGKVIDSALQKKAISEMRYILDRNPQDPGALESVKNWEK